MNLPFQIVRSLCTVFLVLSGFNNPAQAALPSDYDFFFGTGGKVISPRLGAGFAGEIFRQYPESLAIDSQGRAVVGGQCDALPTFCVARYFASGALDDSFGSHGLVVPKPLSRFLGASVAAVAVHADDKISVAGVCRPSLSSFSLFCAGLLNSDGSSNTALGESDFVFANTDVAWGAASVAAVALQSDGKLVVAGYWQQADGKRVCLLRFFKSGQPDKAFGQGCIATMALSDSLDTISISSVVVQSDHKILVAANCRLRLMSVFCLFRYTANGELDRTFGTGGILSTAIGGSDNAKIPAIAVLSDGRILLSGICGNPGFCVALYSQDGRLDETFGVDGIALVLGKYTSGASMRIAKNGAILFLNRCFSDASSSNLCLIRMTKDGLLDATFGENGRFDLRIGVIGDNESPVDLQILQDGKYLVLGACDVMGANPQFRDTHFCLARVKGDSVLPGGAETRSMIEYFHEGLNYFFITSRSSDIALLDANREWIRTGSSISVFVNPQPSTLGISRFYFDQVAKNKTRGSHFYTLVQDEKDALAALNPVNAAKPQLPYNEGIDSYAHPPLVEGVGGSCAAGTIPVYRLFRGQKYFADNPNHRFTTDVATYQFFLSFNWDGEGVKFCVPL